MTSVESADLARLFVAVPLGEEAHARVSALVARVAALISGLGWKARVTADDDLHITLSFLGEVPRARIPALEAALSDAFAEPVEAWTELRASYGPIEVLPEVASTDVASADASVAPRHAWLRVSDGAPLLTALAARTERACRGAGVSLPDEPDHAFRPHITLTRVDRAPADARAALLALEPGVLCADRLERVTLFESLPRATRDALHGQGRSAPHYAVVATFPLRAQAVAAPGAAH